MDIQNDALENTSSLIEDSLNPHKVPLSHSFTLFFSFFFFSLFLLALFIFYGKQNTMPIFLLFLGCHPTNFG